MSVHCYTATLCDTVMNVINHTCHTSPLNATQFDMLHFPRVPEKESDLKSQRKFGDNCISITPTWKVNLKVQHTNSDVSRTAAPCLSSPTLMYLRVTCGSSWLYHHVAEGGHGSGVY